MDVDNLERALLTKVRGLRQMGSARGLYQVPQSPFAQVKRRKNV